MALKYLYSGAGGAGTGADWANAYLTLVAALAGMAAGDTVYVAHDHAETQASAMALVSPGTIANPCNIVCVDRGGTVPPVSADLRTTATISTTGANVLSYVGYAYNYGVTFSNAGGGSNNTSMQFGAATVGWLRFDKCNLVMATTNATPTIIFGNPSTSTSIGLEYELVDTKLKFGAVGQGIRVTASKLIWRGALSAVDAAGSIPTNLIVNTANFGGKILFEGIDLSALGSGKTIMAAGTSPQTILVLKDTKLNASVTVAAVPTARGHEIIVIRSDSSGTNYRIERYEYRATETTEGTIVRTGGASHSRKIVTTANAIWLSPYRALPIHIWNDTVGSAITIDIYGIWGGGAVPNDDEIWIEAVYAGASGDPQGAIATSTSRADLLDTGAAIPSDGSTWGGSTTAFKMSVTFTPQIAGPITIYVLAAKASSTFYIDPEPGISGVSVGKTYALSPGVFVNELAGAGGGLLAHPGMRGGFI